MNEINTLSKNCLYEMKRILRECAFSSSLINSCDELVAYVREDLDLDKFKAWLEFNSNNFKSKTNQVSYFKKSFLNELDKGTFDIIKVEYIPNTQALLNEMRARGICVLADEGVWVNVLFDYLLNEKKVDLDTCATLNHKVLDYMSNQEFSNYKELIKSSNTLKKYQIDWELIEKRTRNEIDKWNDLLEETESEE